MPRDLPLGNGNLLIAFDHNYLLREFYFPHVGEENHTRGDPFRLGVWTEERFTWIPDGWQIHLDYQDDTLITSVDLFHSELQLKIKAHDVVDFHENIYLKKLIVENQSDIPREVRLFFAQDFHIYGDDIGDTAAYKPDVKGILHYKKERYFLINIFANETYGVDQFATGNRGTSSFQGTWRDAEDGVLSKNPIAQGSIDSVVGLSLMLQPGEQKTCYYWISVGFNWEEVKSLNKLVETKKPEHIFKRTGDYWRLWVNKEHLNTTLLPDSIAHLYKRSLLICRTQINNCGSIIAANDSDVIHYNRDTYSYLWPRDGALIAHALDLASYFDITKSFYNFAAKLLSKEGFFLHKYTPSGSLGSSWHPWERADERQIPIQEDETALVIWALWNHFEKVRDVEFIKPLYKPLIKRAADFMMSYRDELTGLPLPSYDLWEERQGVLTFTTATVYAGLNAAAEFAKAFGEEELSKSYLEGASQIRAGMDKHLYVEEKKRFARMVNFKEGKVIQVDETIDASLFAVYVFGAYLPTDEKVKNTVEQIKDALWCKTPVGGLARYQNDPYYKVSSDVPGNPWFVTTLWLAKYYIALGNLEEGLKLLEWVASHALPSGVLAEQLNPYTGECLSVSPLTWSHATFITAVQNYLDRLLEIETCPCCHLPKHSKRIPPQKD